MGQTTVDRLETYIIKGQTGTGSNQVFTHGKQATPAFVDVMLDNTSGNTYQIVAKDNKTITLNVTNSATYNAIVWFTGN